MPVAAADVGNGEGRNRTGDTTVFSRVLYQLSYLAAPRSVATSLPGNQPPVPDAM